MRRRHAAYLLVAVLAAAVAASSPRALAADIVQSITAGGAAVTVTVSTAGDNIRLEFSGMANQRVSVRLTDITLSGSGCKLYARILKPDGSNLTGNTCLFGGDGYIDLAVLPTAGTYTILIDPEGSNTGSITTTLYDVPADPAPSLTLQQSGSSATVTTTTLGQNAAPTFTATAGQRVFVRFTNVSFSGGIGSCQFYARVRNPDGSNASGSACVGGGVGGMIDTITLTASGTHSIFIDPENTFTGSATVTLYEVPADPAPELFPDGASATVALDTPGQNALLPFQGSAGQQVRVAVGGVTIADFGSCDAYAWIASPGGGQLGAQECIWTGSSISFTRTLTATGTHTLRLDPIYWNTGGATLSLSIAGDSPEEGAEVPTTTPALRAEPVGGATGYQFQVASDAAFTAVVDDSGVLPETTSTYTVAEDVLEDGGEYYWRWRTATGSYSAARRFVVKPWKLGARGDWPMWSYGPLAVNKVTGNLVLALPGPSYPTATGSMGVSLSYNSLAAADDVGLGARWTLVGDAGADAPSGVYDLHLDTGPRKHALAAVIWADGSSSLFKQAGSTKNYRSQPGDPSLLTRNQDGSFTLADASGAVYGFDPPQGDTKFGVIKSAEFTETVAGNGKVTYEYDYVGTSVKSARLIRMVDVAGRALSLTWHSINPQGCDDALVCISGPDGVVWRYIGDGPGGTSGRLSRINSEVRDLFKVSYGADGSPSKLQNANDLDPTNASPGYDGTHGIALAYELSGRVQSVTDGPITGQTPSTSTWTFGYFPGAVATTTATSTTHGALMAGTVRTAKGYTTVTPPGQQGAPQPKLVKTFYDKNDHPIESVDVLGNVTRAGWNGRDQLLWSEDETGAPTDYLYDPATGVLWVETGPDADGGGPLGRPATLHRYDEAAMGTAASSGPLLEGLQAHYYANTTLAGRAKAIRTDASVDFDWGTGAPTSMPSDYFSVRWSGYLVVGQAGAYTFSTISDEATRLTVGGVRALELWGAQDGTTKTSAPIQLAAGSHRIVLEYAHTTGAANVQLRWACPTCSPAIPTDVIGPSALRPGWLNQTSSVSPLDRLAFSHFADPAGGLPDYTLAKLADGSTVITSFSYDAYGRLTQKVMPKGNAARTIDANGNLTGSPNLTYATTWTYYALTDQAAPPAACGGGSAVNQAGLAKSYQPAGLAAQTTVYDTAGRPIALTKAAGTSCSSYDAEGRLTSTKAPGESQATTYTYDPAGQLRTATDANGTLSSEYDEAGRLKRSVDSYGAEATFAYDRDGNLVLRRAAAGPHATSTIYDTAYGYDTAGRLTSLTDPASRSYQFTYDARGLPKTTQYPNGTFSWNDYDSAGALSAVYHRHGTLPNPLPTTAPTDSQGSAIAEHVYTRDLEGRNTQETRTGGGLPTETTGYVYDPLGRLETANLPGSISRRYRFDLDSNRTAIEENSQTVASYTYDPAQTPGLDQLTSKLEGGQMRTYAYDGDGNMTARGADTLSWDGRGRHSGGSFAGQTITYGFDAAGFRRQRQAPGSPAYRATVAADNPVSHWRLGEASGSIAADAQAANNATYYNGPILAQAGALAGDANTAVRLDGSNDHLRAPDSSSLDRGNTLSIEVWFKRTATGTLQNLVNKGSGAYAVQIRTDNKIALRKAGTGDIAATTIAVTDTTSWYHFVATKSGATTKLYLDGVDRTGTVTDRTLTNTTTELNLGRSYASGGSEYFNGQLDEIAIYPTALTAARVTAHYTAGTTAPQPQTTRYLLGGLFETDTAGTITLTDIEGAAGDLVQYAGPPITATAVSYLYYNGHGDLTATADQTGARTAAYTYDPFGALRTGTAGSGTSERWTGRWDKKHDTSSGVVEMGARPYDPALGRFLAVDPIEGGSANGYDFCGHDPLNCYDLDGRMRLPAGAGVTAATIILAAALRTTVNAALLRVGILVAGSTAAKGEGTYAARGGAAMARVMFDFIRRGARVDSKLVMRSGRQIGSVERAHLGKIEGKDLWVTIRSPEATTRVKAWTIQVTGVPSTWSRTGQLKFKFFD